MINTKTWFQLRPMYDYIRKQAENEKFLKYLEIGATFSLIAIFLFFAIMPTMTTIFSLLGDIKSKETFIKKVDLKISKILQAQNTYSQVQGKYALIEDSFPSLPQYYKGASNLATIFRDSSLNINQFNLSLGDDKNNQQFFKSYQINVSGEGQYSSIMEMIKKILNNRRLVDITNIQLNQASSSNNQNQTGSTNIRVNLSNNLYFLPQINDKK